MEEQKEQDEIVCPECGGTGEIPIQSQVYPGEPHMADLGDTIPCPVCKVREPDDMTGATDGDR